MSLIKKKLTEEELQQVKTIKSEYTNLALTLGELELQKIDIEENKKQLISTYAQLIEKETSIAKTLTEKYGDGTINMETGEVN
jgi:uncharacterized membrane protein